MNTISTIKDFELSFHTAQELYTFYDKLNSLLQIEKSTLKGLGIKLNDELLDKIMERTVMKEKIISALKDDRIVVYYQPIYDIRCKKFTSAEALVRMLDENYELVEPSKFIPIAEDSGLIVDIGERVFEKVCNFIKSNDIDDLGLEYIEVNISALQCEHNNLYENFVCIMEENKVDFSHINLELTESMQLNPTVTSLRNIQEFSNSGIALSLDDFGTGSSNLDYIKKIPVNIIKFDYTMTQSYFNNEKARIIFKHVIPMVHELGMEIVAEGVESEEQLLVMKDFGIEHIQGYYFSKPIPEKDFRKFLLEKNN